MKARATSLALAVLAFAALAAVEVVIFRGMHERDVLENRNALERVMNSLFASLRDHDDFGSAIESSAELKAQVEGLGVYAQDGSLIHSWGKVPATWTVSLPEASTKGGEGGRDYVANPANASFVLQIHPFRLVPPPGGEAERHGGAAPAPAEAKPRDAPAKPGEAPPSAGARSGPEEHAFLFDTLKDAEIVYLEIRTPAYWRAEGLRNILFPVVLLVLGSMVFFVRSLVLRNADYRRRIEEQRNLVVLGTAASTLAHEIKNPLLSIRLQASVLERLCPPEARTEIEAINAEVERLSALVYRINDYLREPRGAPRRLDAVQAAREAGLRLAGRDLVDADRSSAEAPVEVDADRFRSVLENVIGNAVESGGPAEGLSVEVLAEGSKVELRVLDRGPGIPEADRERVFDPFFTTKSRGTGIGLAISRRFVEAAGGSIAVESRPGGGCLLRIVLPAAGTKETA